MPNTRSKTAEEKDLRVYVDYPASPSTNPPPAPAPAPATAPTHIPHTALHSSAIPTATATSTEKPSGRAPSVRSQHSVNSVSARIRRAEMEAEERLAEIRRKELQLQADLIKKRLAADIDTIREESDRGSIYEQEYVETSQRVNEWIENAHTTDTETAVHTRAHTERARETARGTGTHVRFEATPRHASPNHGASRDQGFERVVKALENMSRGNRFRRPPELPPFSGAPGEWLPFKAAVREASVVYDIPPTESLARLRACLRGEARQCVVALLYTASEPSAIMSTLEQRYGRPEIIIDQALDELKKLPRIGSTAAELNNFAIKLQNIVTVVACVDEKGYLQNPMLARHITEKMSEHLRARWCDYAEDQGNSREAEIVTLSRFFMREAERAVRHCYTATTASHAKPAYQNTRPQRAPVQSTSAKVYAATETPRGQAVCYCCGGEHTTPQCKKLKDMPVEEKWQWAKETKICFLCLNNKHRRFSCKAKRCGLGECRMPHHALLHPPQERRDTTPPPKEDYAITASAQIQTNRGVLLKVCPVTIKGPAGEIETYGLLDEGSTVSLIDRELAAQIGAQGPTRPLNIHGVTSSQREASSQAVDIEIRGRRQNDYYAIRARTVQRLELGNQSVKKELLDHRHLRSLHAEDVCYTDVKPRVLIGADNWHLIVSRKLLTGKRTQPAASLTKIGWVIHGTIPKSAIVAPQNERVLHIRTLQERDSELHDLVKSHFELDSIGIMNKPKPVAANERAVEIFEHTAKRINGRFEVGLPWRTDDVQLPPSYDMALRRLKGIERKMDKTPAFKKSYMNEMEKLTSKGYATRCEVDHSDDPKLWYLPHFAVTNPNKPGKIRLVFDSAARASGTSMNDALLDGPDLLRNLNGVLYRFRERPVAITADIREMFLQVKIRAKDRTAQHFLWRGDERTRPPDTYVMTSMIFGARSSPFLAHSVRNKNAEDHRDSHPLAYVPITKCHYMDDWVQSFDNEEIAKKTMQEVTEVHKSAGFELASWSSNRLALLGGVDSADRATTPKELGTSNEQGKTLGLRWIASTDELAFNTNMPRIPLDVRSGSRTPTKREALGAVMSVFDPSGQISPYVISAKVILQSLWRHAMSWDDPLPPEEAESFAEWIRDIEFIEKLRIPRCYSPRPAVNRQLHVFVDASEQAYAAAAYWRHEYENENVQLALIAGKAKVAPMKPQSIPRMELQASLIGARLSAEIRREHEFTGRVVYWSDSKTALHWIRNDSTRYTPYVAHRLGEIAELTNVTEWKWIPTALNVADDATRAGNTQLKSTDRWFVGPSFLREPEELWPTEVTENTDEAEVLTLRTTEGSQIVDFNRFSSYERLLRTVTNVLRFVDKCRKRENETELDRVKRSERLLLQQAQSETFFAEITRLRAGKTIDRSSRLLKLDPQLTEDGILRLHGRINAAPVSDDMKKPPLLDGRHALSRLLIECEHKQHGHIGREHVVNNVRQKYWILRLRPSVRKVLGACHWCDMKKKLPGVPVKGDLPKERVDAYTRPFSRCGLDGFGPMWVTIGRRREKRWGLLATCLVTRAVHIELLASLSTDSAIMAIRRLAARRGFPVSFHSDNGTNFHGSDVEMNKAYQDWLPELRNFALTKKIEWRYTDPGAPNQGGAWERLIKSVKAAIAMTLADRAPKEEVLATALTEIESTINSRPLTHVSVCEEDPEALTPNHLLLGTALGVPIVGNCEIADRRAWRASQALANAFWARWITEYLPTLTPRGDIRKATRNVAVGDVVIIADGLLPRGVWPRGLVERIYTGPDGVVRSADVRTRGGIFRRPVRRLVVLPTESGCEHLRRGETVADSEV